MGYVHDTQMSQYFFPPNCHYNTGAWTDSNGAITGTIAKQKTAADNTAYVTVPISLLSNGAAYKGSYLKSINVYWECITAACDAVTATIIKAILPADTVAFAAIENQAFTYDAGHDTAPKRITIEQHAMTLTLTTPIWMESDELITVQIIFDAAATSALTFFGAKANYTLRL